MYLNLDSCQDSGQLPQCYVYFTYLCFQSWNLVNQHISIGVELLTSIWFRTRFSPEVRKFVVIARHGWSVYYCFCYCYTQWWMKDCICRYPKTSWPPQVIWRQSSCLSGSIDIIDENGTFGIAQGSLNWILSVLLLNECCFRQINF